MRGVNDGSLFLSIHGGKGIRMMHGILIFNEIFVSQGAFRVAFIPHIDLAPVMETATLGANTTA